MSNKLSLNFNRYKPKQNFTYSVNFVDCRNTSLDLTRLSYAVSNVSLVKVPIQTIQDDAMGFGLYWNIIPIHDIDSKEMRITFEETDDMLVTNTFAKCLNSNNAYRDLWNDSDTEFIITITTFNEYKIPTNSQDSSKTIEQYRAIVKDFQHPTFSRTGNVDKLDVTVVFKVMLDEMSENGKIIQRGDKMNYIDKIFNRFEKLKQLFSFKYKEPDNTKTSSAETEQTEPKNDTPENETPENDNNDNTGSTKKQEKLKGEGTGTADFTLTDGEIKKVLNKINSDAGTGGKNVTFDELKEVMTENVSAMRTAYSKLQDILNTNNISVSINAYYDTGHGIGLGTESGSHLLAQKVDLTFYDSKGNKITAQNMTAEQKKIIANASKSAGLVTNYESTGAKNSFWGDFSLANAKSIDKSGNIVTNKKMVSWTGNEMYNTKTKSIQNIG